jgi:hypothetical protein
MIVYQVVPIDCWDLWKPLYPALTEMKKELMHGDAGIILNDLCMAFMLARKLGWEGDIRSFEGGPYIAALPAGGHVIAWKQDNNGTTFIASPFELPWISAEDRIAGLVERPAAPQHP